MPPHEDITQKPKHLKQTYGRLLADFKSQKWVLMVVLLFLVASGVLTIISPSMLSDILGDSKSFMNVDNTGTIQILWSKLFQSFGILLAVYISSSFLSWISDWILEKVVANYTYLMRKRVKEKLDTLPLSYFDKTETGEILQRGTNDIDNIGRNLPSIITSLGRGITVFLGCIIAMFIKSWQLALVVLSTLPLTLLIIVIIAGKSRKQFKLYRKKYGELESQIEEGYSGFTLLKLFNREEKAQELFDSTNAVMTEADRKSQWISGFIYPAMRFIYNLGFVAVSLVAGFVYKDAAGIAMLVAFIMYLNIFQQPFEDLGQIYSSIQSMGAAAERIYIVLDETEEKPDDPDCIATEDAVLGDVVFDHVAFSYDANKPLITDMNLHVKPGEMVAIVGPTGAGKTTLVNLLMRFYEVNSGAIVLDGVNINHYSREALRGAVGMVLQDTWLFSGSIKDNIRYGRSDATDEDIKAACVAAHADHFIETLPGGYDFQLKEEGSNISQGQRQLLTIARAIVSKPKIMILDEATSSVDTRTEQAIQDAMEKMMQNRTSFVIAHRLSTIKNAKLILVMNKGSIIEMGTHKELLAKQGFYADLYNAQFLGNNPMAVRENETEQRHLDPDPAK
jgi:ATP-binding cassette subfamily B multidrug efflux pump